MKSTVAVLTGVCVALLVSVAAQAQTITLEADYWMPYNGDGKTETGYMIDLAKAVFEAKGLQVKYSVTPWARAIKEVRAGQADAVIGAGVDDASDFVFPKEEQGLGVQAFYVKAGSPWKYSGTDSLKKIKLGVIKDYTYFAELDSYIKDNPTRLVVGFGDDPLKDNLRLLLSGSVDAVVDATAVLAYTVNRMGIKGKVVDAGSGGPPLKMFIAFSPARTSSARYAKLLSDGTAELRKSGALAQILAKYGLTDWK